ncbi:hypothetical protein ABZV91_06785 [Nocardia sp. NPDC004568]
MRNVGILLAERDESAAAEAWYAKAIDAGDTLAMYNLGVLRGAR